MQQTETYKLNLIEKDDVFSPDALNENTQEVEKQLSRLDGAEASLDARVTALEIHKIVVGTYAGNGKASQFVSLGFTPVLLLAQFDHSLSSISIPGRPIGGVEIVEGGFTAASSNSGSMNQTGITYNFAALI